MRHIYEFNPLRQIRVSKIMSDLIAVDAKDSALDLFRKMDSPDHHLAKRKRMIVLKDGFAIGAVDRAQLYEGAAAADPDLTVEQVCSKSVKTINDDEFGFEALRLMTLNNVPYLVVVDKNNKPVGYVSRGDLIKAQRDKVADDTIIEKGLWSTLFRK